jgi:hypothetical protein
MYLMQQLEKIFNETTLCANVARLRRFALWSSILPNCVDTTLRGAVSSQNVGTESCTVVLYLTGHGLQGSPWNHCMIWSDTEPIDNQLDATAATLQETTAPYNATSPLHKSTGKSKKKWKRLVLSMVEEILFPGSLRNCLFSRELVLCLHHFPHDFVSLSQLAFRSGNMCNIEVMSSDVTARF